MTMSGNKKTSAPWGPKPTMGMGFTDQQGRNVLAEMPDETDKDKQMTDKRKKRNPKAMEALKNAAPLMDFICMVATEQSSVAVAELLNEMGYSASGPGVIARAKRIRKGSKRRKPINLPLMSDEKRTTGLAVSEDAINDALESGDIASLKLWAGQE